MQKKEKPTFNYKPFVTPGQERPDPTSTLNPEGKKVMEKLRHFITRQNIYDFVLEQEVSAEAVTELRKIVMGGK